MQSQLNDVKRYFGADIQRMLQEFEVPLGVDLRVRCWKGSAVRDGGLTVGEVNYTAIVIGWPGSLAG